MRVKVAHLVLVDGVIHEIEEGGPIPGLKLPKCTCPPGYSHRHEDHHEVEAPVFRIAMATIQPDGWTLGWFTNRCEYDVFARGLSRGRAERRIRRVVARGGEVRPTTP